MNKCLFFFDAETPAGHGVTALPTFLFFRNKAKLDAMRGADAGSWRKQIKKWYGGGGRMEREATRRSLVKGHVS